MKKDFWKRGIEEIINEKSFLERLKKRTKLRVKYGVDPTKPDIHLGHIVALLRLREMQNAGHTIIFLIGDYTTKIGDPSGRNKTRPMLSDKEIKTNSKSYFEQVGKLLDINKTEIRYNSEWYKKLNYNDLLQLTAKFTVAQILEREDFKNRLEAGSDLSLHELLYPVMQAYDSVMLKADIEFGGTDQKFNMLAGRALQKKLDQIPQEVVMVKLLVGLDGKEKMSKSLDNYVGITEAPEKQYGKIMSIPDSLILEYFDLVTTLDNKEINKYKKDLLSGRNPKELKEILAYEVVRLFNGSTAAREAAKEFNNIFSKRNLPADIPKVNLTGNFRLTALLLELGACGSTSEARRFIIQGAVKIDSQKITDVTSEISVRRGMIIQVGKLRYFEIR